MVKTQNALQLQIGTNNVILDNAIRQEKKYAENKKDAKQIYSWMIWDIT